MLGDGFLSERGVDKSNLGLIRLYADGRVDWVGYLWAQVREQESARYDGDPQMVVVGWEWVGETRRKT